MQVQPSSVFDPVRYHQETRQQWDSAREAWPEIADALRAFEGERGFSGRLRVGVRGGHRATFRGRGGR